MRHLGKLGLAALAAMTMMAFVGVTPASALKPTQLCNSHTSLDCAAGEKTTAIHMALAAGTVGKLLAGVTVLCLGVLVESSGTDVGGGGKPQSIDVATMSFTGCGTGSAHNDCTVTVEELPDNTLLKTGLDAGSLEALNGRTRLACGEFIDCEYDLAGSLFSVGAQHLTANETPTVELGKDFFCPDKGKLDGLLKTLVNAYVLRSGGPHTSLCNSHSSTTCAEENQVKSLHMVTTKPPVLYNTVANIECESSLGTATVLWLAEPQKLDLTELSWKECHTQGAADNCTVTSKALPTIDLERTALNSGTATALGLKVGIDCLVLGLIELECVYGSDVALLAEGALHKEGTGHGMLTASKAVLKKTEGGGHCPESVKWEALYEPLEHVYIVQ